MKRLHVHNSVRDLDRSVAFYTALFGQAPSVTKPDYAKWMLDDPAVNFAISTRGAGTGVDHLGFQFDDEDDLDAFRERAVAAGTANRPENDAVCCYAHSDKHWSEDPDGLAWEGFRTMGEAAVYHAPANCCAGDEARQGQSEASCCG